jgi:hypothetical protein
MDPRLTLLANEHRPIEAALDRFGETVAAGRIDTDLLLSLGDALAKHYANEEKFLIGLFAQDPALATKLRAQHDEVLEIAWRLQESLLAGNAGDAGYLGRRLVAMAQHNMIEEERDVFPVAEGLA